MTGLSPPPPIWWWRRREARSADSSNAGSSAAPAGSSHGDLPEPSSDHAAGSVDSIWSKKSSCLPAPAPCISRPLGCMGGGGEVALGDNLPHGEEGEAGRWGGE
uniref:Uncharacterized protein n=1 Tax=Arundo donax TaxID=35708 RepID=A0A0A8YLV7_ARUDO